MFEGLDRPILQALRLHVELEADVSDALTALHARESSKLGELLHEARVLASQLDPSRAGIESRLDLETWLRTVLRGPHDHAWFDTRVQSGRRGWADMPPLPSALLIARVRHRLTEMAGALGGPNVTASRRVADAVGRLFDLEVAIVVLNLDTRPIADSKREETRFVGVAAREAALAVGSALAVIETSAYLIGRYSDLSAPRYSDVERHLIRIAKQVESAKKQLRQLLEAVKGVRPLGH